MLRDEKMTSIFERLNKPEYFFRPRQLLRRMQSQAPFNGEREFTLPWGLRLRVEPSEAIGRAVDKLGLYDLVVTETLWRLLEPGEHGLDVGANVGHMTSVMVARALPAGKVTAFEPHPSLFQKLRYNVGLWSSTAETARVALHNVALSDYDGHGRLRIPSGFGDNAGTASLIQDHSSLAQGEIQVARLDTLVRRDENPVVMKLDVEGGELAVLKGASALLSSSIRDLVFEDHENYPSLPMQLLESAGYSLFRLGRSLLGPRLSPITSGKTTPWEAPSFLATRDPGRARKRMGRLGWDVLKGGA